MDTGSTLFHKAKATVAKQAAASSPATKPSSNNKKALEGLFNVEQGT
jgi:hypothetical protein